MSGTLTLAAGEIFTGGTTVAAGQTGQIAFTQVGNVSFNTVDQPPIISDVEITKDGPPAVTYSGLAISINAVTIESVGTGIVTVGSNDLPSNQSIPPGFTLPVHYQGTTADVSVQTNVGVFTGIVGLFGLNSDGSQALVAVETLSGTALGFDPINVADEGAAILSLGAMTEGSNLADNFTPAYTPACFGAGTHISTPAGDVPVERLRVGDQVLLAQGGMAPVIWLGHRTVECRRHPRPWDVWPVRVMPGAFGEGQPFRPLDLSPDHAVFVDGVLVPVKHLINGRSIVQLEMGSIEYWHVEVDRHAVLFAEGLPAETYLDTGNRSSFDHDGVVALHADFAPRSWDDACAPLLQDGPLLAAIKARLFRRAGGADAGPASWLQVQAGPRDLLPEAVGPGAWRYALPPGVSELRLVSLAGMPAAREAASLDRRRLGVRLFGLELDGAPVDLEAAVLASGFHPLEQTAEGPCRWTDGRAELRLPPGSRSLTLRLDTVVSPQVGNLATGT